MKHSFKPVPSTVKQGSFFAECSISGHRPKDSKSSALIQFKTESDVVLYSNKNISKKLSSKMFKDCANTLLARHGASLLYEDASPTGSQSTFKLCTRFGPAEVTPVDTWIIFRFLEPHGKSFPWGMTGNSGSWNFHSSDGDLSALLEDFAEGLAKCTAPGGNVQVRPEALCEVLPPCVMKSGAGFYVGSYCKTAEGEYPHSRYSDYFRRSQQAQTWLTKSLENQSI